MSRTINKKNVVHAYEVRTYFPVRTNESSGGALLFLHYTGHIQRGTKHFLLLTSHQTGGEGFKFNNYALHTYLQESEGEGINSERHSEPTAVAM